MREELLQNMVLDFQKIHKKEKVLIKEYGENSAAVAKIKGEKNRIYNEIEKKYNLQNRVYTWFQSYGSKFDSYDDFLSVCKTVFYESLLTFKTVKSRTAENIKKYNNGEIKKDEIAPKGNGELNTYFAYCISNKLVNYHNASEALCRNPKVRCPICFQLVAPLKKHLKNDHEDYVLRAWKQAWNKDMKDFKNCPICGVPVKDMFSHVVTRHPNVIYDLFRVEYPQYMLSEKPYSLDYGYETDENEGNTLADTLYNEDENTIIDSIAYNNLLNKIKAVIKDEQELRLLHLLLQGYNKAEVCEKANWSQKKYAEIKGKLVNNSRIKEILATG